MRVPLEELERVAVLVLVGHGVALGVEVAEGDVVGGAELVAVLVCAAVLVDDEDPVPVWEADPVREDDAVSVLVAVAEFVGEAVLVYELEEVPVVELEGVHVREDEAVPELEAVDVRDEELVLVGEELDVSLVLGELENVPEVDGERVDVAALDALTLLDDDVDDPVALRRLAMLRPRNVRDDTAASASPASHSVDS